MSGRRSIPDDHFVCHRSGDMCAWKGCPRTYDDRATGDCYLIQPTEPEHDGGAA